MLTNTTDMAVAVCPCNPGYFRPLDGSEDAMPCTREYVCICMYMYIHIGILVFIIGPPSAPQNITFCNINSTSAFIVWEAPEDNGSRTDLFYTISLNFTNHTFTNNTYVTLTGLIPFVHYMLSVTSENGVSAQDDNDVARTETTSIMTLGGNHYS